MAAAGKKKVPTSKPKETKNVVEPTEQITDALKHTYINVGVNASPLDDHTYLSEAYGTVPPPPPALPVREGGASSSPIPRQRTKEDNVGTVDKRSPTPPLPERKYDETDIRMTPPPPLPQRQLSNEDSLTPPPLPERHYTASDVALSGCGQPQPAAVMATAPEQTRQKQVNPVRQVNPDRETKERSKSFDSIGDGSFKFEISEMGHQYAIVTKGKTIARDDGKDIISPPPLPKRFRERFNENSPFPSTSNENIHQSVARNAETSYVDVDHSANPNSKNSIHSETIAYAVVKVDGSSDDPGQDRPTFRRARTPRPYEDPFVGSPTLSYADSKSRRGPAYEEIVVDKPHNVDGKMKHLCYATSELVYRVCSSRAS